MGIVIVSSWMLPLHCMTVSWNLVIQRAFGYVVAAQAAIGEVDFESPTTVKTGSAPPRSITAGDSPLWLHVLQDVYSLVSAGHPYPSGIASKPR